MSLLLVMWLPHSIFTALLTSYQAGIQQQIQNDLGATHTLATLGVGLYNLGGVFGVLIGGPLSELYGRRPVYILSSICFFLFSFDATLSPNVTSMLICRALTSLVGSPVFAIYAGSLADLFSPHERGLMVALFTIVLQGAPTIGPVPSAFLGSFLHWRWLLGFLTIWGGPLAALMLFIPETEPAAIARKLARSRGSAEDMKVPTDEPKLDFWSKALLTPFKAYPHIYKSHYSMTREQSGLVFVAPFIGNVLGVLIYFGFLKPQHEVLQRMIQVESGGKLDIEPEARLPGLLLASLLTPIGLFWLAFSANPEVHYFLPVLSGVPIGIGMTLLQLSLFNYCIDLYPTKSASAIAANTAIRNVVATIFPSVALPLYNAMGIRNANMMLACISCIGFPTGVVLYVFGRRLRAESRWAKQTSVNNYVGASAPLLTQGPQNHYGGTSSPA
ncbi:major facilitator superfamily domain-containing protein [Scleroderma yunnanense]